MKVAVLTVLYPAMIEFADEYFTSLKKQTYKDFDLIIVNDHFQKELDQYVVGLKNDVKVFDYNKSPQQNRLFGFKMCMELGYDVVICSDSDEAMYKDRIEKNIKYFKKKNSGVVVFNNSVGSLDDKYFDLYYKDTITINDILDFNVLGYGAMNVKAEAIPFILEHGNESIMAFDWWIGAVYLLHHKKVDVLKDARNYYRLHSRNFIGPVFETSPQKISLGLRVKYGFYDEMEKYCKENGFKKEQKLFNSKTKELNEIQKFIDKNSIEEYCGKVQKYLAKKEKIYWWQDVVPLKKMRSLISAKN